MMSRDPRAGSSSFRKRIGFLTIGQSPREDVLDEIRPLLTGAEIVEAGALDALSSEELAKMSSGERVGGEVLVSRLRDGSSVTFSRGLVTPLLRKALERLRNSAVDLVVLLCTGMFDLSESPVPVILPGRIMKDLAKSLLAEGGSLGMLVPLEEQEAGALVEWREVSQNMKIASMSPYERPTRLKSAADELRGCDLVVMNCIGYTRQHKSLLREEVEAPVLLPRTLVARLIQELLD